MYLASATRPDISFAVSKLSRFVSNPKDTHWHALERVLRYLNLDQTTHHNKQNAMAYMHIHVATPYDEF